MSVHPLRSLLALRTMNLRMTLNLLKSLCDSLCTPGRQSSGISVNVLQSMALVMSRFHESHPKENHSLVLSKQLLAVVESCSDCVTPFLCYFDKFLIFFFFF